MTIEVVASTQMGPESAVMMIQALLHAPAIESVMLRAIESDCVPLSRKDANYKALHEVDKELVY